MFRPRAHPHALLEANRFDRRRARKPAENATPVTPGSASSLANSSPLLCRHAIAIAFGVSGPSPTSPATMDSAGKPVPASSPRMTRAEMNTAAGNTATATATCATINAVQVTPSRVPLRPCSSCRLAVRLTPVAFSPGTTAMMSAESTASPSATIMARGDSAKVIQYGRSSPVSFIVWITSSA